MTDDVKTAPPEKLPMPMIPTIAEWEALMGWHADQEADHAWRQEYLDAHEHKSRCDTIREYLSRLRQPQP